MKQLKVLDIFAGIGGFSYGLEQANKFATRKPIQFVTKAFCEIDVHAQKVLNKHWPDVPVFSDVTQLNGKMLRGKIDIICGGFPCQDISVAGKKKGLIDEDGKATRSGLWFQYKRLIEEIRPRWVLIENVANLRSNGLATVLKDLSEIGYDAEWDVISARDVGACHLRERIWIVAYPSNYRCNRRAAIGETIEGESKFQGSDERYSQTPISPTKIQSSDAQGVGVQGLRPSGIEVPSSHGEERIFVCDSEGESDATADADDFRFWPTFATEEEKSEWWASTTSQFRSWWEVESRVCRVDDGLPKELDKGRAQRIKQLGNSIVPAIVTLIGRQILEHEN